MFSKLMSALSLTDEQSKRIRSLWKVDSLCLIYSRSEKKWYDGQIHTIEMNEREWLIVKYKNDTKTKRIQRMCADIKPIASNMNITLVVGSFCLIYSNVLNIWCKGQVISIFNDCEGEWLTIKYWDTNEHKICDIQRYSKQLKIYSERLLYQSIINIPNPPKPWKELNSNNGILPLKLSNIVKLNENEFIVSGYSNDHDNYNQKMDSDFWSNCNDTNGIYKYNISKNEWQIFIKYPKHFFSQYHNMSIDYQKQIIYFIVGFGGVGMWAIDIETKRFRRLALPIENLYGALSYVINSQCNIFWGNGNNSHLIWTGVSGFVIKEFKQMTHGMISYGMVYNKKENYFLLFGGFKGQGNGRSDEIWKYNPNNTKWEKLIISLPDKMQSFGCLISLNCEYVLILGGTDSDGLNDKIYILNLLAMQWSISKIISPFRGIGFGNFIMIKHNNVEYVHLLNGMYSSMQVPLSVILRK